MSAVLGRLLRVVGCGLIFTASVGAQTAGLTRKGFQRPTAPASGPAPFLTEAVSVDLEKYITFSEQLVYPTRNKTDAPYYDVPFAVNVPFEVPFDGGAVRVFFDVNIVWDEPEQKVTLQAPGSSPLPMFSPHVGAWKIFQQGIYRLDGAAIPADSAKWEVDASRSRPMTWQGDGPFPLLLTDGPPSATHRRVATTNNDLSGMLSTVQPRRPFTNLYGEYTGFASPNHPIVLQPAKPGWYALWFSLAPALSGWPANPLRADDTLRAKIYVHYIVARRERFNGRGEYFYPVDFEVLWTGADKKPTVPIDPNLVRAHTLEIPLTLRRDGWVFVRAEVTRPRPENDSVDATLPPRQSNRYDGANVVASARPNARGFTATYKSDAFTRGSTEDPWPRLPAVSTTLTWDVVFPDQIMDGGAGVVTATGSYKQEKGSAADLSRSYTFRPTDYVPQRWISSPGTPEKDPRNVHSRVKVVDNQLARSKEDYLQSWAWRLADPDGSRYWQLATPGALPVENQATRFTVIAQMMEPHSASALTKELLPIFYQDLGPQALFKIDAGPWRVEAYYRRKKDPDKIVSSTPTAGVAKIADEKDGFYDWFVTYSRLLHEKDVEVGKLETEISVERELWQQQRRRARVLLDAYQTANDPGSWTDWFASSHTKAEFSETMLARLIRAAGQANTAANAHLTAIKARIPKIRQAHETIVAEIDRVFLRYIDRHPELSLYKRRQRALLEAADFKNALGTGDLGLFHAALARANLQPDSLQPEALVAMAQLQLENGETMGAIQALRSAVRLDPENADARARLRDVECSLIKVALEKSQGAIAEARKHFYGYLKERGFDDKDQAWVGGMRARGLARYGAEGAWATFSTGVTGAVSGLLGRQDQEALALDATEREMTAAFLGAHAILRLRMRGLMLADIKALSSVRLQQELMADTANAPTITLERAKHLGLAIHQAFLLPELKALLTEDAKALQEGLAQGYWNDKDVGNTWAEWIGDLSSPKNLVMMLMPMSIGRAGGQLQGVTYWTRAEASFLQGAMRTGYVDSGTMVVARLIHFDRALGAIGGTQAGTSFIKLLERSQQYQESLGLFGQAGWTLGKMVAVMALQGLALHEAEQLGGPRAAMAVEALLLFGGDTDLLIKFLDGARISRQTARMALDHFRLTAELQVKELRRTQLRMVELQHQLEQKYQGKPLPPLRRTPSPEIAPQPPPPPGPLKTPPVKGVSPKGTGTGPPAVGGPKVEPSGPRIPNGQPGNDSRILLEAAEDGLEQGSDNGAIAASKKLEADLLKEADDLAAKGEQARQLSAKLASAPPAPPPPPRPTATGVFASPEAGNYVKSPHPGHNETWVRAERALDEGNFQEAEDLFLEMKSRLARDTASGARMTPYELPLEILERKIAQASGLKATPKPAVNREMSKEIVNAIPDSEVESILEMRRRRLPLEDMGASGTMSEAGEKFMVKELVAGQGKLITDSEVLLTSVEAELVAGEIARALGHPTPGINVKARWRAGADGRPEMESAELVYRRVIGSDELGQAVYGKGLHKLTDAELFHVRDQVAEHRVLAILLGDYDRKPDNYMILGGLVHALDAGQADVKAAYALREFGAKASPISIAGQAGNDHWWTLSAQRLAKLNGTDPTSAAKLAQVFLSESALTFEHAAPALQRIKERLKDPAKLAELQESIRTAYRSIYREHPRFAGRDPRLLEFELNNQADDVVEAMKLRLSGVEEAMKDLNLRSGKPRPTAAASRSMPQGLVLVFPGEQRMAA